MILIVIDSLDRYYFARRLVRAVRDEFDFLFLTSEPVAHCGLRLAGYRSILLRRGERRAAAADDEADSTLYGLSIEVLNGEMSEKRAKAESAAVFRIASAAMRRFPVTQCLMWNGQQLACRAVAQACAANGVPTKFMEISNLPSKLFVDSMGVNALSTISRNPAIIDSLPMPDEETHRNWLGCYERYKSTPLPQSRTLLARKAKSLLNHLLKFATASVTRRRFGSLRARNSLRPPAQAKCYAADTLSTHRYVFLPLQVAGDTQIKLHSDVDNLAAIRKAAELAARENASLFVKPHPAETDAASIREIVRLQEVCRFELVTSPTTDLIKHAHAVVTINSTVGLEAMLYGKRVVSLGRCFYREFDRERLLKYIHSFLVDGIDYFGSNAIAPHAAREVILGKR
ncbi:capsular polysaccharide export protein [Burkholderia multivorans]